MTTIRSNPENSTDPTDETVDQLLEHESLMHRLGMLKNAIEFEISLFEQQGGRFRDQCAALETRLNELDELAGEESAADHPRLGEEYRALSEKVADIEKEEIDPRDRKQELLQNALENLDELIDSIK